MSTVYLAAEEKTDRLWAVKAMRKQSTGDFEMAKQSLLAEASILKKLKHPGLPEITEVIERENTVLIIMDYVEGYSLERIVKEQGPQREENAVNWAKQLCDILSYLHTRNPPVIYRDMKPSNIIRREDGRIVLIDFGTAREFKGGQKKRYALSGNQRICCSGTIRRQWRDRWENRYLWTGSNFVLSPHRT